MTDVPWAMGPADMLRDIRWLSSLPGETHRRAAFILIDNTVELMLRSYLSLQGDLTFPEILAAFSQRAHAKLQGVDEARISYYHDIRNHLYHRTGSITVHSRDLADYETIAVQLYHNLYSTSEPLEVRPEDYLTLDTQQMLEGLSALQQQNDEAKARLTLVEARLAEYIRREQVAANERNEIIDLNITAVKKAVAKSELYGAIIVLVPERFTRATLFHQATGERNGEIPLLKRRYNSKTVNVAVFTAVNAGRAGAWAVVATGDERAVGLWFRDINVVRNEVILCDMREIDV
jgi:hypothetical protein